MLGDPAGRSGCAHCHRHKKIILATLKVLTSKDSSGEEKVKITVETLAKAISFGEGF